MELGAAFTLGLAFLPLTASADVESGIAAWERGEYEAAVRQWRPLAQKGDADAQFNLAQAYRLGRGVPADVKQAEGWYARAATQGHPDAEDYYGLSLFESGKRAAAMPWIQKSAARGDPRAQYVLGTAHFNGDYVSKDWVRAYALTTRSAASGYPKAAPALREMDRFIPLRQREDGIAMARAIETRAMRPQIMATVDQPIKPAAIPPSQPSIGAPYPEPGSPSTSLPAKALPKPVPTIPAKPIPAIQPATGGKWRIQLGAFGNPDNATALWSSLERNVDGLKALQPYLVKSTDGKITRLQAGPFAKQGDAEKQCGLIKSAAQNCLIVKPSP